ncbi:hypothetical protein M3Y97_00730100 [Aphelenchoides bicaudatus]|nr:hypothetical protein M3Y97_00730100 [Aphelenchoides bicaudatus]
MANIPYQNVDNQFKFRSRKGQVPFVELNGRQIPDTNFIIAELARIFGIDIDEHLNEREQADFCRVLISGPKNLSNFLASEDGLINHFSGVKKLIFRTWSLAMIKRSYKLKCRSHGIGKHTPEEVEQITKKNLRALSIFLGDKHYLMGDQMCTLDATAFGHLCMFYYAPLNKDIRNYIETDCRNLADYLRNVREELWPDWNEATSKLSLATKPSKFGNNLSNVETLSSRPKILTTPLPHPDEPRPEGTRPGSIEVFDVDESARE